MIYWIWFLANGLISLFMVIRMWPASLYAEAGTGGDFGVLFGFLPAWFIFVFGTLSALVLMYVPKRRNRGILYGVLFVGSLGSALILQHSATGPIACLPYSVIGLAVFLISATIYKNSEYYDPSR